MSSKKLNPNAQQFFPITQQLQVYKVPIFFRVSNPTFLPFLTPPPPPPPPPFSTYYYADHHPSPPLQPQNTNLEPNPTPSISSKQTHVGFDTKTSHSHSHSNGSDFNTSVKSVWRKKDHGVEKLGFKENPNQTASNGSSKNSFSFRFRVNKRNRFVPVRSDGFKATVMIKNIPNKYTRSMMMAFLDSHCEIENKKVKMESNEAKVLSAYDFLYLPIDFKSGLNKGYAFVNFSDPKAAWKLHQACNNQPWPYFNSKKICKIAVARVQGKENLEKHFMSTVFPYEDYAAISFSPAREGNGQPVREVVIGICTHNNY